MQLNRDQCEALYQNCVRHYQKEFPGPEEMTKAGPVLWAWKKRRISKHNAIQLLQHAYRKKNEQGKNS
jgi:hypothetical protein